VRFVEVTINGQKSWSLAAELHTDVATAYEAAQDRAAAQVIGWLAAQATTRVGPRGAQVAVPVDRIDAVTVRHYTSRAGDPHRHLHLQVNARVFAAGKWRGLDTVAVRDSIHAINGIGHAAVACDPEFRAALAGHGTPSTPTGRSNSSRSSWARSLDARSRSPPTLIGTRPSGAANIRTRYRDLGSGGRGARAWADARPDRVIPEPGADVHAGGWLN
jgi:exodeoxyribonuclease V alpha subunit